MIRAADVGIGVEGKEGRQAAMASDFSVAQFKHILRLIVWHGRNSYKRSAMLSQFIIHRGVTISWIQVIYSAVYYWSASAIFTGWLLVGYPTIYTMVPFFFLVLDEDIHDYIALRFPELYRDLQKGRMLSMRSFFEWNFISMYQGCVIMIVTIFLFETNWLNVEGISFTALIFNELLNLAFETHTWTILIFLGQIITLVLYVGSLYIFAGYFDTASLLTWEWWGKVLLVTLVSCLPVSLVKWIYRKWRPPGYEVLKKSLPSEHKGCTFINC
ncbi:phospholipid-translocating P-type ATPase [Pelomyxa schiedti]|nr:phospholipid-translocating P-type ATPase [Pelomyxa schiedti]